MLLLSKISTIVPYSPEWFEHRKGYMTGSLISCICSPKGIGDGGYTYIRNKVSEIITGVSTEKNITTEATLWGIEHEPASLREWQRRNNVPMILTDKHIVYNNRYSVTPDGLAIRDEKLIYIKDGTELNCETVESKSYMTPAEHMKHIECNTPEDIKDVNPKLFWQCVSQVYWSGVLKGHATFFHPNFPEDSVYRQSSVEFRRINMKKDFDLFEARTKEAEEIFEQKLNYRKPIKEKQ